MKKILLIPVVLLAFACNKNEPKPMKEQLPSWNDTPTKQAIIDFVTQATTKGSKQFIPVEERIAVFDNDGTLWCEHPLYFPVDHEYDMTMAIAKENQEIAKLPWVQKLITDGKAKYWETASTKEEQMGPYIVSHTAVSLEKFNEMTTAWLDTTTHQRFHKKYNELTYVPMVELLKYLQDNQFKTYIVTGGSNMFVRRLSSKAYNIPEEQVIGLMFKAHYNDSTKGIELYPEIWHNTDKEGKCEAIFQIIGKKPVFAFGNSDGDVPMLNWTKTNTHPNLALLLHHTDAEREYAYDSLTSIGKLKRGLNEAATNGFIIVDMKQDFKKVFSFEK